MNFPASIAAVVEQSIRQVHGAVPGVTGCVVATVDGRLIDHYSNSDADPQRIAAMIGSMVALGETIGKEVKVGRTDYVVVQGKGGILLMQQIPSQKSLLVVATLASTSTNVGIVLHQTRHAAASIADSVDAWMERSEIAS